jgi:ribosomal protein L11 methyltransferase
VARTYPALDLRWSSEPDPAVIDRTLAEIDDESPTAVEHYPDGIRVFFASSRQRDQAAALASRMHPSPDCTRVEVPDEDWAARSQAQLGAVTIARIVVTPPWARQAEPGQIELIILPSMGFGTGHHASTRLCLRLLQRERVEGARVVDVGTGSGVLALAASKLGARRVLALDSDPDALEAAADSVKLNDSGNAIELRLFDLGRGAEQLAERFDIVLANLTGALLIRHARAFAHLTDGRAIVSGFERDEESAVRRALQSAGLEEADRLDEDGWVGMTFRPSPIPSRGR